MVFETNENLKLIMSHANLTAVEVADIAEATVEQVRSWCSGQKMATFQEMPYARYKTFKENMSFLNSQYSKFYNSGFMKQSIS